MTTWWARPVPRFFLLQLQQVSLGIIVGSLIAVAAVRLAQPTLPKWLSGYNAYRAELFALLVGLVLAFLLPTTTRADRYVRAWWAGTVSATAMISGAGTLLVLWFWPAHAKCTIAFAFFAIGTVVALEYWRHESMPPRVNGIKRALAVPARRRNVAAWRFTRAYPNRYAITRIITWVKK
jgi:hypothetical protein